MDEDPRKKLGEFVRQLRVLSEKEAKHRAVQDFEPDFLRLTGPDQDSVTDLQPEIILTTFSRASRRSIDADLVDFVADAIERFLNGTCQSLDAAFALRRKKGRPKTDLRHGEHFKLAEKLVWLRMTAKDDGKPRSWAQIDSLLTEDGDVDGSSTAKLSKIHQRYHGVVVEDIVAQVLSDINDNDV